MLVARVTTNAVIPAAAGMEMLRECTTQAFFFSALFLCIYQLQTSSLTNHPNVANTQHKLPLLEIIVLPLIYPFSDMPEGGLHSHAPSETIVKELVPALPVLSI